MNLSSNRRHNQSSVLGLASRNQPSTLLAHFDAPQPQCQACNLTGHRQSQCETTSDKSVSFLAWHKLLNKTPWPPIAEQIKNLTYCLNCLEEHHETYNKVNARQVCYLLRCYHCCCFPPNLSRFFFLFSKFNVVLSISLVFFKALVTLNLILTS
ncbi:unnamed protein product [Schistosoma curassoni]|uniref:CCHC-type domain-containing protein n=1 Tax=Schistosoma curassoni TaxID=6186 RepID=A0A183L663_9TREM|nr:unnamed protein product [Schistosoma curassoni]